jgi:hypothetical protein
LFVVGDASADGSGSSSTCDLGNWAIPCADDGDTGGGTPNTVPPLHDALVVGGDTGSESLGRTTTIDDALSVMSRTLAWLFGG